MFMATDSFLSESPPASVARLDRGFTAQSQWAVEQRLARAERELRLQFTRIAQMQAQLDLLTATLRRSPVAPSRDRPRNHRKDV
jgi:hypothetical protein